MNENPGPDASGEVSQLLEVAVSSAPNGIIVVDESGRIALVNRKAQELFGYERDEFLRLRVEDLVPERFRATHAERRTWFAREPGPREMGVHQDLYGRRKDGVEFPVEIGLSPVKVNGSLLVVAAVIDISPRRRAEEAVRLQAEILGNVHDAVFLAGPDGVIKSWNNGAEEVYGYQAAEAVGAHVQMVLPGEEQELYARTIYPCLLKNNHWDFTSWCVHKSGKRIAVALRARLLRRASGEPEGAILCGNDITQQRILEQRVIEAAENEQQRIGRDIHDDLCQQLASIGCFTKVVEQRLRRRSDGESARVAEIGEMIAQANVRAREIARDLVPSVVESDGLAAALEDLAKRTGSVCGLECRFVCPDEVRLASQPAVQLYRVAQEAVSNAVRHSRASRLTIALHRCPEGLILSIEDDGCGMAGRPGTPGLGLLTMEHRVRALDGRFSIHTAGGRGTRIECTVPDPIPIPTA